MKPHYLTSHDTVSNLDTAFNPSSPPQLTEGCPLFYKSEPGQPQKFTPLLGKLHRISFTTLGDIG